MSDSNTSHEVSKPMDINTSQQVSKGEEVSKPYKTLSFTISRGDYEWITLLKDKGESWEAFLIRAANNLTTPSP